MMRRFAQHAKGAKGGKGQPGKRIPRAQNSKERLLIQK